VIARLARRASGAEGGAGVGVAVGSGVGIIGALGVIRSKGDQPYSEEDQAFYEDLANRAGMAIENARLHTEIKRLATMDALTNVYNRRAFFELGKHEIDRFLRYGRPLSVIMIDIDHFKRINDTYGHGAGDKTLQTVAQVLRSKIRALDIIGRYGGDEFAILLPETDKYEAMDVGYRILKGLHEEKVEEEIRISLSMGIYQSPQYRGDLEGLLEHADLAMYQAKQKGGDRIELG
jgi:diguanylate cyclase (GGDEF)-like protein